MSEPPNQDASRLPSSPDSSASGPDLPVPGQGESVAPDPGLPVPDRGESAASDPINSQPPAEQPSDSPRNLPAQQQGRGYHPTTGMSGFNYSGQKKRPTASVARLRRRSIFSRSYQTYQILSAPMKVLCLFLAVLVLGTSLTGVFELINGLVIYNQIEGAMSHLKAAGEIFTDGKSDDLSKYFDVTKLKQVQSDVNAAHSDFVSLSYKLDNSYSLAVAGAILPSQMTSIRKLDNIAVDGTAAAQQVVQTAIEIAPVVGPGLKAGEDASKPYLDQASYDKVIDLLTSIQPLVHNMSLNAQGLSLVGLPIDASEVQLFTTVLNQLPAADTMLQQVPQYKDAIGWLLGIGGSRTILVAPMDNAELRSTGGLIGQFGELTLTGAHMAPLNMKNLGAYEEDHRGLPGGSGPINEKLYERVEAQTAPGAYGDWWPFANFGMRDANVSADFPTSAQIILDCYENEFQKDADGMVVFTPQLIKEILEVTGPITIAQYNETVTAQNLESKLHYYQLDNAGIHKEEVIEHQSDSELARKLFTQRVTQQLMTEINHLPIDKLAPMVAQMWQATKTKDLQMYFTNKQLEGLVAKYGSTTQMDRSNSHDGVFIVQSNDSGSKASQYVTTSVQDSVTVDSQGAATHNLTLTLNYQQKGSVYGADAYRDFVRIYVPKGSKLLGGNGFSDVGNTFCTDPNCQGTVSGDQADVYSDGTLVCTSPVTVGDAIPYNDKFLDSGDRLYTTGKPSNSYSDESGKTMFSGWVIIPKNCVMKVTVSWTTPAFGSNYDLLVQAQAGLDTKLDLTVDSANCSGKSAQYSGTLQGGNMQYTLQKSGSSCALQDKAVW